MKKERTNKTTEAAFNTSQNFTFTPTRDVKSNSDKATKSRDKKAFVGGVKYNIAYPAYKIYRDLPHGHMDPLDYRSFKNVIQKLNIEIVNYSLLNMKSFKFYGLGVVNVMYRKTSGNPEIVQNYIKVLEFKFFKKISRYAKRYSLSNSNYIKRLIRHLTITRRNDFTQKDFIMINSKL